MIITLFDKSFFQSLSLDESVWFDHFYKPVVCPIFYMETLADLAHEELRGRTPDREVQILAMFVAKVDPETGECTITESDAMERKSQ